MIELHGQISMAFLKKSRFTGSYQGMRYLLQKAERTKEQGSQEQEDKTETVLEAVIWPEPFHYEKTEEEKKQKKDFTFHEDGRWEAVGWLNEEFLAGHF